MEVEWSLVRRHLLRHTLLAGGSFTALVLTVAWYWEFPVSIAALGLVMLTVGATMVVFREGDGPTGRRSGLVGAIVPDVDRSPSRSRDRAVVYFLLGVLSFAGGTVLVALARLKL